MTLEELFTPNPRNSQCRFGKEYALLDDTDKEKVKTAFLNNEIPTTWIWSVLTQNGFTISESTTRTHRKGNCRTCGKIA